MKQKTSKEAEKPAGQACIDRKCPFHGEARLRGRIFIGTVKSAKAHLTATVEWERRVKIKKYERYEKRRSRVYAHNPQCMNAAEGDKVRVMETRPLSKTKNFAVIEVLR